MKSVTFRVATFAPARKAIAAMIRERVNLFLDLREVPLFCLAQVVFAWEIEPELGVNAEIKAQPQPGFGANSPVWRLQSINQLKGGCETPELLATR